MWRIDLSDRVALVSGASRGIGRAIALGCAEAGADVVGVARTREALEELGGEVEALGRGFLPLVADLSDAADLRRAAEEAWGWRDGIEVLVNTAGVIIRKEPPDVTAEDLDTVFATNVRGTFLLSQEIGVRMIERGGGSIVNMASVAGQVVTGASTIYQASKAAVIQMTRALAVRFAPSVRVNAVGPGYIRTSLNATWLDVPENERYVLDHTPLDRVGAPDDVVAAVLFLASPAAGYITGQTLMIDGGWSTQ